MAEFLAAGYEFGPYRLDSAGRALFRHGQVIPLPPKAVAVLLEVVRQPGLVVAKQALMNSVWPDAFVEEANLIQMIFLLRRAFGNGAADQEYIVTLPRRGYRFAPDVRTIEVRFPLQLEAIASRPVRPEAHSLYLKGRYFARSLTEEAQRKAIRYFRDSIQADPDYAGPYAGIAECFTALAFFLGMAPKQAFSEAKPAAVKAVQLEETLGHAHAALGLLRLLDDWDWKLAEAELDRAVELGPGDAYVHWKRGMYLQYAGRFDEAVAEHRRAEQLDPFSLVAIEETGWPLYYSRRYDEAAAQFRTAVELSPDWHMGHFGLGLVLIQQANYEGAVAELRSAAQFAGDNAYIEASLAYSYGRAGYCREAQHILERLTANQAYVPNWFLSLIWVGMGKKDSGIKSLEQAFNDREPCMVALNVEPMFDPLRADARFSELVRRVGRET